MGKEVLRVQQIRSAIRRPGNQEATLIGLGLNKIGRIVEVPDTPSTRGMITKVRHLVRVLDEPVPDDIMAVIEAQLETLRRFNRRVDRVEKSRFWKRYEHEEPRVVMRMENTKVEQTDGTSFTLTGRAYSALTDFDQDDLDAFVLSYRMFTQDNDPISIRGLSRIYASEWMPKGARENFEEARGHVNEHLRSAATIAFGERTISIRELADIVVYGGLAHANPAKAREFESWEKSGIMGIIWAEFFAYLRGLMETLKFFRTLNAQVLDVAKKGIRRRRRF